MKKLAVLVLFVLFCLVQPVYPADHKAVVNSKRLELLKIQGGLEALNVIIKEMTEKKKALVFDGNKLNAEIKKIMADEKLQRENNESLKKATQDSAGEFWSRGSH